MDQMKIVIKVCYHGLLRFIICEKTCSYRDILKLAIKVFNIPKEYTAALKITNESGYIFEPKLFEYFIILFPSPEIIFYIRLDYTNKTATLKNERPYPFGYSKFNNKRQRNADEFSCYGTPVRRQNCFIGTLPATSTTSEEEHSTQEIISQIAKRRRYNEATHKSVAKVTRKNTSMRSIRL